MLQVRAKILYNKKIKGNYFYLALRSPEIVKESLPGQFLMVQESIKHFSVPLRKPLKAIAEGDFLDIRVNDTYGPLLRRPFSVHTVKDGNVGLLYEVVGQATQILSRRKPGEELDVIGPLGNGFTFKSKHKTFNILVAGGMGVAPLTFLAEKLIKSKVVVLMGAKTKSQIICEKKFKDLGCEVKIATDDGSKGFKGYVSELLSKELSTANCQLPTIYACGPKPMLKEVSRVSKKYTLPAQLSLEEHMACGIGACLGCVVNTKDGFKRVCKEGPVFSADKIIW